MIVLYLLPIYSSKKGQNLIIKIISMRSMLSEATRAGSYVALQIISDKFLTTFSISNFSKASVNESKFSLLL